MWFLFCLSYDVVYYVWIVSVFVCYVFDCVHFFIVVLLAHGLSMSSTYLPVYYVVCIFVMFIVEYVCHQLLISLQQCLAYNKPFPGDGCEMKGEQIDLEQLSLFQTSEEDQENPEYLKDDLIFKMVVMSLLCVTKLQTSELVSDNNISSFQDNEVSLSQQQYHRNDSRPNLGFKISAS
ncbi:hypothetical protein ANN_03242 [Periplaneta americana]|uniref:Uncharacterized protein n=1 Tax=Periplaneta americana TaxID=6978 RepID=A0ABQ8U3Q8_PERAM|nr:hypothetical protein ANN_03242 [Periplaneta americana]